MVQVKHLSSDEEHMESIYREFLSIYSKGNVFKDDVLKQMKINRYSPENDYIEDRLKKDNISNKTYDGGIIDVKATPVKLSGRIQQNKSGTYKVVRANQSYGSFKKKSDAEFILEKLIENDWDKNIISKLCEENKLILKKISSRCHELILQRASFLKTKIFPELKRNGIRYIKSNEYTKAQKSYLYEYFKSEVFPVLTPLRTDTIILPHIPNLKLVAAFLLEAKSILQKVKNALTAKNSSNLIALVQIPENLERLIWLPSDDNEHTKTFALLEDVISSFASELFPGYKIKENLCFKVNRDADLTVDENNSRFHRSHAGSSRKKTVLIYCASYVHRKRKKAS